MTRPGTRKRKKKLTPKTGRKSSRKPIARPAPIIGFLKKLRFQGAIQDIGGEVKSLRRELRLGVDRLAKRIESFGRSLQKQKRTAPKR